MPYYSFLLDREPTPSDFARRAAPGRALGLLFIALMATGALRLARVFFGWSFDTATIILGAILAVLLLVGLPMALAGGWRGYGRVDVKARLEMVGRVLRDLESADTRDIYDEEDDST